jgi:hypothetical protein
LAWLRVYLVNLKQLLRSGLLRSLRKWWLDVLGSMHEFVVHHLLVPFFVHMPFLLLMLLTFLNLTLLLVPLLILTTFIDAVFRFAFLRGLREVFVLVLARLIVVVPFHILVPLSASMLLYGLLSGCLLEFIAFHMHPFFSVLRPVFMSLLQPMFIFLLLIYSLIFFFALYLESVFLVVL